MQLRSLRASCSLQPVASRLASGSGLRTVHTADLRALRRRVCTVAPPLSTKPFELQAEGEGEASSCAVSRSFGRLCRLFLAMLDTFADHLVLTGDDFQSYRSIQGHHASAHSPSAANQSSRQTTGPTTSGTIPRSPSRLVRRRRLAPPCSPKN